MSVVDQVRVVHLYMGDDTFRCVEPLKGDFLGGFTYRLALTE